MALIENDSQIQSVRNSSSFELDKTDIQVVEFLLGKEKFAIDLFEIREVVDFTSITPLPNSPTCIKGIIDLRGDITTIVDLRIRLDINEDNHPSVDTSRIIVLDENITMKKIGILVDDVTSVSTFEKSQVDYASSSLIIENSSIIGIIKRSIEEKEKIKNELIIWINIKQLLQDINYSR